MEIGQTCDWNRQAKRQAGAGLLDNLNISDVVVDASKENISAIVSFLFCCWHANCIDLQEHQNPLVVRPSQTTKLARREKVEEEKTNHRPKRGSSSSSEQVKKASSTITIIPHQ